MRTFLAIFPPEEVQKTLASTRNLVEAPGVRWVHPRNIHLTLKFLGDVPEEKLGEVNDALGEVAGRHEPFRVGPRGLGAFPSLRKARVLWAGVEEGSEELAALAMDLENSLASRGFGREKRRYQPHVTLGRMRKSSVKLEDDAEVRAAEFVARRLDLVGSEPGDRGAVYSILKDHPLGGT